MPVQPSRQNYFSCDFCGAVKKKRWRVAHGWRHLVDFRSHTGHACPACYNRISMLTVAEGKKYAAVVDAITRGR